MFFISLCYVSFLSFQMGFFCCVLLLFLLFNCVVFWFVLLCFLSPCFLCFVNILEFVCYCDIFKRMILLETFCCDFTTLLIYLVFLSFVCWVCFFFREYCVYFLISSLAFIALCGIFFVVMWWFDVSFLILLFFIVFCFLMFCCFVFFRQNVVFWFVLLSYVTSYCVIFCFYIIGLC